MKKETNVKVACCSTRQKIWGVIALAGLFACGLFLGAAWNGDAPRKMAKISMTAEQCEALAREILDTARGSGMPASIDGACTSDACVAKLRQLNEIYTANCADRMMPVKEQESVTNDVADEQKETCEVIEDLLMPQLVPVESPYVAKHSDNIEVYKRLLKNGCPENADKYKEMISREMAIIEALKGSQSVENTQTCAEIESLLMQSLPTYNLDSSDIRIDRAKIYANLSERGCPENAQQYVNLAAKELEIARALRDDKFDSQETVEVVETYKRLEMKQIGRAHV